MLKEYDMVKAKKKLSDKVLKNSIGTIVLVFPEFSNVYMVEFMENRETLDVLIVKEKDVEKL